MQNRQEHHGPGEETGLRLTPGWGQEVRRLENYKAGKPYSSQLIAHS